ncbi:MAG: BTAD domain-containing putative transcriptional regulator [Actinomycetota bacterium]
MRGTLVDLGGSQQRHVLALLVSSAGNAVSTDTIIDDLWGEQPPATARKTIQGYVSSLRRALPDNLIASTPTGYSLSVEPASIDAHQFQQAVDAAGALSAAEAQEASAVLTGALTIWRGAPFEGINDSALLQPEIVRLNELHVRALEDRAAADLFSGREAAAAADLADLTARNPLRERLWALRVLALYRSGRQTEALRVSEDARRTLATEAGLDPSPELRILEQRILEQDPILNGIHALDLDAPATDAVRRNPYKGLRAFDEDDAGDFYGRTALVRRLVEAATARNTGSLRVVAGPSGSGKSSLVRAGLTPALRAGGTSVDIRFPDSDLVASVSGPEAPDVLVIDQLEEIFATGDKDKATQYLNDLTDVVERDSGSTVVVTIRADVMDDLLQHDRFAVHVEPSLVLVTPLEDHEIRDIVASPAANVGVRAEPDLVASIVNDAKGTSASLPLVQYALTDLFDRTSGDTMTLAGLRAAGGIGGALSRRADETLAGLDPAAQDAARNVFLRLITIAEDGTTFRRRTSLDTIESIEGGAAIVQAFSAARLLATDRDRSGNRTVEVAHEAILAEWPRIVAWVDEAREAVARHRQLSDAATEWDTNGRPDSLLLVGSRLARLSDRSDEDLTLSITETEFLVQSEDGAAAESRSAQRRRRAITAAFGVAALVAIVLAGAAFVGQRDARRNADTARSNEEAARTAEEAAESSAETAAANEERALAAAAQAKSRELSQASLVATEDDPQLGILLAVQATNTRPPGVDMTIEERLNLRSAVDADLLSVEVPLTAPEPLIGMDLSPDGSVIALLLPNAIRAVSTATWDTLWSTPIDAREAGTFGSPVYSPDGQYVALGTSERPEPGRVLVYDTSDGTLLHSQEITDAKCAVDVFSQSWSRDGRYIAASVAHSCEGSVPLSIQILDTETWTTTLSIDGYWISSFAEESDRMFAIDGSGRLPPRVYDALTWELVLEFDGGATYGDIHPDGTFVGLGQGAVDPSLVDVQTGNIVDRLITEREQFGALAATDFLAFSTTEGYPGPVGHMLAVGTQGRSTTIWSLESGHPIHSLPTGPVNGLNYDAEQALLYTASQDGTISVWDLSHGGLSHPELVQTVYWFDANSFVTNPQNPLGTVLVDQGPIQTIGSFERSTGSLVDTGIAEVAYSSTWTGPPLRDDGFAYLASDGSFEFTTVEGADWPVDGPLSAIDHGQPGTQIIYGCQYSRSAWNDFLTQPTPQCPDGSTALMPTGTPILTPGGGELLVADIDGNLYVWDTDTLELTTKEQIAATLQSDVVAPMLGWDIDALTPLQEEGMSKLDDWGVHVEAADDGWVLMRGNVPSIWIALDRRNLEPIAAFSQLGLVETWATETSHDGSSFIYATSDGDVYRVDTSDWTSRLLAAMDQKIRGISLSPDNGRIMLGGTDGLVYIIDAALGNVLDMIKVENVSDGYWLDDSRIVVGTGVTGQWGTLDLDIVRVANGGLDQLTRGFTANECAQYRLDPCPTIDDMRAQLNS